MKRVIKVLAFLCFPWIMSGCNMIMVGDSITWTSKGLFEAVTDDSYADGIGGRGPDHRGQAGGPTIREAIVALAPHLNAGGWLVVQDDGERMDYWSQAAYMMDVSNLVPDDRCIAWIAPHDFLKPEVTVEVAQAVRDFAYLQPCNAVVPWDEAVLEDPSLLGDGIHPTPEAVAVLVELVLEATDG